MNGHRYTDEEKAFMSEIVPGHSYAQIKRIFTEKFGWEISTKQIKTYITRYHLNTGRTGRFEQGDIPSNAGKKMTAEVCLHHISELIQRITQVEIVKIQYIRLQLETSNVS